jgi:hypothetical protein
MLNRNCTDDSVDIQTPWVYGFCSSSRILNDYNKTFVNPILYTFSVEDKGTPTLLGPLKGAVEQ